MKSNALKIFLYSFFLLYIISNFYFLIYPFKNITWIGFNDFDQGYLIEQFINFIDNDTNYILSSPANYGIELYYFGTLFKIIQKYIILTDISIFYFLSSVHLFAFILSMIFTKKIFDELKCNNYSIIFFLFLILSCNYFYFFSSNLKPDLNILLLSLILSNFFLIKYLNEGRLHSYLTSIFFACLATSIKIWGVFIFFQLIYIFYKKKIILNHSFSNILVILNPILIIIWLILLINNGILFEIHNVTEIYFFEFLLNKFIENLYLSYLVFGILIFTYLSFIFYFRFEKNNFFLLLNYTFVILYILLIPFIFDFKIFLSSIKSFFTYTGTTNSENLTYNFFHDIKNKFFSIISTVIILIYLIKKKWFFRSFQVQIYNRSLEIYIFIFYLTLNIFFSYENQSPGKFIIFYFIMLYSIVLLSTLNNNFLKKFLFFCIITSMIFNFGDIYKKKLNYILIEKQTIFLNQEIKKLTADSILLDCGGLYPSKKKYPNIL